MENLIGKQIGNLLVISETRTKKGRWSVLAYVCQCDCGNIKTMRRDYLLSGRAKSCGCYRMEAARKATITHGLSKGSQFHHPLYDVWSSMIQRCHNENNKGYPNYGARDIKVCDEWRTSFQIFFDWAIAKGYRRGLQIDRIDVNKGYSASNCRWVSSFEQARNKTTNVLINLEGEVITLQDLANITGVSRSTLYYRYKHNKPLIIVCANQGY